MKTIKNKKQQITLAALSLLFLFTSCSDFLSREPLGTLTKDDFEEGGSFEGQVMGLYADLRSEGTSGLQFVAIHSIRSDDADKGSTVSDGIDAEAMFDNFSYVATHWLLTAYWTHHYQLIHHANSIISDIEELGDLSDYNTKVNMGEAKFMRAYAYFNLVRTFGEIPKIDFKVQVASEANIPKSSVDDIYALIDADLAFAVGALPTKWPEEFKGRLTSGAAYVLQARTFVTRQNWQGAYTAAKAVITSGVYDLNTSYDMIFREVGELNSGSILKYRPCIRKQMITALRMLPAKEYVAVVTGIWVGDGILHRTTWRTMLLKRMIRVRMPLCFMPGRRMNLMVRLCRRLQPNCPENTGIRKCIQIPLFVWKRILNSVNGSMCV